MASEVSRSDLAWIADARVESKSGYHGVYREANGNFEGRFFQKKICSGQPTAREAAIKVIQKWKAKFGARWRDVWFYRQTKGWRTWRGNGGWWAVADVVNGGCGGRGAVVLIGRHPEYGWPCPAMECPGCKPFRSEKSARDGVRAWAKRLWGKERRFMLRREWTPGHSAARCRFPVAGHAVGRG